MTKISLLSILHTIRFYVFAVLYFLQILSFRIRTKNYKPLQPVSLEINLLNDGEIKLTPKPSQMDAMANKAKFGIGRIPNEHKGKALLGIGSLVWFLLFGIGNTIYWMVVIIRAYNIIGWTLLSALITFVSFKTANGIYQYFNKRKYVKITTFLRLCWQEAKRKTELKFNPTY